jgi:hypothetical protein
MGDRSPLPAGEASDMEGTGAGDNPEGGPKRARAPQGPGKVALKKLLKAGALGVVHDLSVSLSFTMDGLTYSFPMAVAKVEGSKAPPFPELHELLESYPRRETCLQLLGRVVRAWRRARVPGQQQQARRARGCHRVPGAAALPRKSTFVRARADRCRCARVAPPQEEKVKAEETRKRKATAAEKKSDAAAALKAETRTAKLAQLEKLQAELAEMERRDDAAAAAGAGPAAMGSPS